MNKEQIAGQLRIILPALFGILGFNAVSPDTISLVSESIVNISFSLFTLGMMAWSWHSNKTVTQIDTVSKMKEVLQPIVTTKQIADVDLKDNPNVVSSPPTPISVWDLK